jgi:hypothetical protein
MWIVWREKKLHAEFWWGNKMHRPLGRHGGRLESNIKMDLKVEKWEDVDWIMSVNIGKRVNPCKNNSNELSVFVKFVKFLDIIRNYWLLKNGSLAWRYLVSYLVTYLLT